MHLWGGMCVADLHVTCVLLVPKPEHRLHVLHLAHTHFKKVEDLKQGQVTPTSMNTVNAAPLVTLFAHKDCTVDIAHRVKSGTALRLQNKPADIS